MKRDLSPSDFAGLIQQHELRQQRALREFEANPSACERLGNWRFVLGAVGTWTVIFLAINAPAIYRFIFN